MADDRKTRPELERDHPYRRVSDLWSQVGGHDNPDRPSAAGEEHGGAAEDFVAEGVRSAYSVIEDYLGRGRLAARQIGSLSYSPLRLGASEPEIQARWIQLSSELIANWFDLLGLLTESLTPVKESPEVAAGQEMPGAGVKIGFEVASVRPAQLEAQLHSGQATVEVTSAGLHSLDGAPPIAVECEAVDPAYLLLRLAVSESQPPGSYSGVLVSTETGAPVGTVGLKLR